VGSLTIPVILLAVIVKDIVVSQKITPIRDGITIVENVMILDKWKKKPWYQRLFTNPDKND
jgi:hypothetical protein